MKKKLVIIIMLIIGVCIYSEEKHQRINNGNRSKQYKALLVGDENGNIYYQENVDDKLPLASTTKMMTLLIAFEDLKNKNIDLKEEIEVPEEIMKIGGSRIWMKKGITFTLDDLIKASAIYSANNATQALAYYLSNGNIEKFVDRMNKKLEGYNLSDKISFYTPTGLPTYMTDKKMDVGSAKGLYFLSIEAEKNKKYIDIASTKETKIKVGKIRNRNKLLGKANIYGIKTGHHDTAGYNISIVSKNNGIKLFVVVLGAENEQVRDNLVLEYIAKFNDEYIYRDILKTDVPLSKINVLGGEKWEVNLYPDKNLSKVLKKGSKVFISIKKYYFTTAPVDKKEVMGEYEVFIDGEKITNGKLQVNQGISFYSPFKIKKLL